MNIKGDDMTNEEALKKALEKSLTVEGIDDKTKELMAMILNDVDYLASMINLVVSLRMSMSGIDDFYLHHEKMAMLTTLRYILGAKNDNK